MFRFRFNPPVDLAVVLRNFDADEPDVVNKRTLGGLVARHATPTLTRHKKYAGWKVEILGPQDGYIDLGKSGKILPFTIERH